ncbi:hypothetical protein Tco_0435064 [Tanacetum coccineum]
MVRKKIAWEIARMDEEKGAGTPKESTFVCGQFTLDIESNSDGKLILEDPQPGVRRVGIPRPPRASMYQGVFEHMAGVYSVPMQGAYNPPGYAQLQYDQYYQQYPPPPPQYQQQQDDDE